MKNYTIAVAGTGYVGLSIATLLSQNHKVYAVDIVPEKVELINNRKSPIQDEYIEKYLAEKDLDLTATLDAKSAYKKADFVVIAAPTNYDSVTQNFNTAAVEDVIKLVMEVNPDATMVIKSTIPVGYTKSVREKFHCSNILFSPEFLRESKALYDNLYPSRIIVGTDMEDEHLVHAAHEFAGLLQKGAIKEDIDTLYMGFGILSTYDQVGYYYNADKVVNIPLGIIAGFGTVSLPRIVSLIATKKYDEYKKLVAKSISLIMFLCSAIVFGIITIVKHFVPLFFGAGFDDCIILISVLSFTIYFKSISTVIVNQVLIPSDNEKQYVASVFGSAFINTIVNYFLILRYGALGAVIATLLSELIVCLLQILMCKKNISISKLLLHNAYYVFAGIIMCVTTKLIVQKITINSMIVLTAADIVIGAAIYCGLCMVYWAISKDQLFFPLIRNALKKLFVWRSVVK